MQLTILELTTPNATAKTIDYKQSLTGFVIVATSLCVTNIFYFQCIHNFSYIFLIALKAKLFFQSVANTQISNFDYIPTKTLPIYTILILLYQETEKLSSIIKIVSKLNYPNLNLI